jgi:regulator of protease activity HflC (stomatin/prohibitin superfamily)
MEWTIVLGILLVPVVLLILFLLGGIRVINQYERGVVLTLGKYSSTRNPGLTWIFPIVQSIIIVDLRISTVDIPQQEAITKDNVPVGINGVVYFRVEKADLAVLEIQNYSMAVSQYAQAALRDVIGSVELDALLAERDKIADEIKKIVDEATNSWGVNVNSIKIQDIELPADMKRVMAKQAESERERRAVIIRAEGELKSSENLSLAAQNLSNVPGGMSLRTLKTIESINPDPSKTVIFALPVEILDGIKALVQTVKK